MHCLLEEGVNETTFYGHNHLSETDKLSDAEVLSMGKSNAVETPYQNSDFLP